MKLNVFFLFFLFTSYLAGIVCGNPLRAEEAGSPQNTKQEAKIDKEIDLLLLKEDSTYSTSDHAQQEDQSDTPTLSSAEEITEDYFGFDVKMPEISYLNRDEIVNQMNFIEELEPSGDEYSGYKIFIPKGWQKVTDNLLRNQTDTGVIYGDIATFISNVADPTASTVKIEALELEHNISAKNWIAKYFLDFGYMLEGIQEDSWSRAEALGVIYEEGKVDYRERVVVYINGPRVITMRYASPLFRWDQEKQYQATVAKSFQLTKTDPVKLNKMTDYSLIGYADLSYPSSWEVQVTNQKDYDRPYVRFVNPEEVDPALKEYSNTEEDKKKEIKSKGLIWVQAVIYENTNTSIAEEIERQKETAQKLQMEIVRKYGTINNVSLPFPKGMSLTQLDIYQVKNTAQKSNSYELWIATMKNDFAYFFVTMITPSKDSRYFAWVENKSAFEGVVSSLVPQDYYSYEE
ncbi:MAG: hypothetical protein H6863_04915 [Rhodospirillales bacterium]|nr:hypothetical protein [Rhodospirillales bacterium]